MRIIEVNISIVPEPILDEGEGSRSIRLINGKWNLPSLYPREVRFVAALEQLVAEYNRGKK